ncbi:TonB family protein [Stenotrophomonas sp. YIM B06876]|uniref:TonB family protein n=1 Tax=Stenotrophomonas sp. YIM B06876 TaxID=3060211 RepID=UPI002739E383|nr:TonB family protein [Stenotrophomonas sp. YIM B06876]
MKRLRVMIAGVVLLTAMPTLVAAAGAGPRAVRQKVESSMLVRGNLQIGKNGSVAGLDFHREDKLPAGVVALVRDAVKHWRFEPVRVEGQVVDAIAPMSLRVVARKAEGDSYEIGLRGVSFDQYDSKDLQNVASIDMKPPRYPEQAFRVGASGTVYLVAKVGRDGKVEDAFAEQVNLRVISSEPEQRRLRDVLARSALAAARQWTFRVPSEGETASQPFWSVRIPVNYSLESQPVGPRQDDYGRWISYVPGPRERAPWRDDRQEQGFSPDTLDEGGVYMADSKGPRLLTPLQGS